MGKQGDFRVLMMKNSKKRSRGKKLWLYGALQFKAKVKSPSREPRRGILSIALLGSKMILEFYVG
jgi:hypothetical protein